MAAWPACASTAKWFPISRAFRGEGNRSRQHHQRLAHPRSSDEFFNVPLNLLLPGRGINMGDGWETRRRRGPGHDWTIIKLGSPEEFATWKWTPPTTKVISRKVAR